MLSQQHSLTVAMRSSNKGYSVETALAKLSWETFEEANARPVLNLSSRNASLEENKPSVHEEDTSGWDQGQLWEETQKRLQALGFADVSSLLPRCPQLLRLQPAMVLETAEWVIKEFGNKYLESEPRLLCYRPEHAQYGLEFMGIMMMTDDAKPACRASPALLMSGIEGGIQEQAIKSALGAAGSATSKASQTIAGDAMAAVQALQKHQKRKL
jgi:hypothetical protein